MHFGTLYRGNKKDMFVNQIYLTKISKILMLISGSDQKALQVVVMEFSNEIKIRHVTVF